MLDNRFWLKVNKSAANGCWEWTSCKNNAGYGMFSCRGLGYHNKKLAHRLSYEDRNGPIDAGKHILHACDNPSCVNPDHLSMGTRFDNMRDCSNKFRSGNQVVTSEMRDAIISDYLAGVPRRDIANRHGISRHTVSDYVSGRSKSWELTAEQAAALKAAKCIRPGAKLTSESVSEIKKLIRMGMDGVSISKRFGVHKATISDIKNGKCWMGVD